MKRLITILFLLVAVPCLAAPIWRISVKVERPGSEHADSMRVHSAKHDSVQADYWMILQSAGVEGWAIIDNANGTQYVVTVPDTIQVIGPIRSALVKYNQRVTVRKRKVEK